MTEYAWSLDDRMGRLFEMEAGWFFAVSDDVNLEDLIDCLNGSGRIVRCRSDPAKAIRLFATPAPELGCIAGWISEEDP